MIDSQSWIGQMERPVGNLGSDLLNDRKVGERTSSMGDTAGGRPWRNHSSIGNDIATG